MEYPKFKVSVSCMTYNHSKYITDAMNGFTMQQTSFPFVCTIVDDASTDGEQEVIRKYVEENFDLSEGSVAYHKETDYAHITYAQHKTNKNCYFTVLYLKENHYSQKKDKSAYLKEWRNDVEYMAFCEGDDYWIVKDKLTKQVKFLDENLDYGLCYSKAKTYYQKNNRFSRKSEGGPWISYNDLIRNGNCIHTPTVMLRLTLQERYVEEIKPDEKEWRMGDYPIWIWFSYNSKIHFINENQVVYRYLEESASHSKNMQKNIDFLKSTCDICDYYIDLYNTPELKNEDRYYKGVFRIAINFGNYELAKKMYKKINSPCFKTRLKKYLIKIPYVLELLVKH